MSKRYVTNWTLVQYVVTEVELEPTHKLVMISLANFVKDNWTSSVPMSVLMRQTGYSRNTIRKALDQLTAQGFISTLSVGKASRSSVYRIEEPVGFAAWRRRIGVGEGQMKHAGGSNGSDSRVTGSPLKEEVKDNKRAHVDFAPVEKPLSGPARRDAVRAARLISKASKSQN